MHDGNQFLCEANKLGEFLQNLQDDATTVASDPAATNPTQQGAASASTSTTSSSDDATFSAEEFDKLFIDNDDA